MSLKPFLADQRIIAGLGNIYACEALYRARLSPKRGAATIASKTGKPNERARRWCRRSARCSRMPSRPAARRMRDYRQANGELGAFQHAFCVYGREGKPCLRKGCGGTVRRIVQAGRSTFYCPKLPALVTLDRRAPSAGADSASSETSEISAIVTPPVMKT